MAKPTVIEYEADLNKAVKAVTTVVARLGYTLGHVDKENGIVAFETGMSINSWAGQKMSAQILDLEEGNVQITIGGNRKSHGAQLQVYDWGEAGKISGKIFQELDGILGEGKIIQGSVKAAGCFIATAVYDDYDHPQVMKFRRFRDNYLQQSFTGRAFIWLYYRVGPAIAFLPQRFVPLKRILRRFFDRI